MDRDPKSADNLQERKNILIADIMTSFRDLINHAAAPVDNTASTGQTAYSSMALETMMSGVIKSTEDLLTLTRKIRELWVVGPLKAPAGGGAHADARARAEQAMRQDADHVFAMLDGLRDVQRQRMLRQAADAGGGFAYERGAVDGPAPLSLPLPQSQPKPQPQPQLLLQAAAQSRLVSGGDVRVKVEGGGFQPGGQEPGVLPPSASAGQQL
ncbi:hypothetical protein C8A00DRAFT_36926 [Chaetomidium leptoderma]|uniref:Mediator of RNA polymerase II transcription subunit 22 n=1 Tax=Chaetomidium leptoderma TaxID=669021 RepID=A0AAN6VGM8_9PEZI|nr:hypothetical protein C8A00DRAFT_36926 [Chaetomidium leptoderma]